MRLRKPEPETQPLVFRWETLEGHAEPWGAQVLCAIDDRDGEILCRIVQHPGGGFTIANGASYLTIDQAKTAFEKDIARENAETELRISGGKVNEEMTAMLSEFSEATDAERRERGF